MEGYVVGGFFGLVVGYFDILPWPIKHITLDEFRDMYPQVGGDDIDDAP